MDDLVKLAKYGLNGSKHKINHAHNEELRISDKGEFIQGFEGLYSVTKKGIIFCYKDDKNGVPVKTTIDTTGHEVVRLENPNIAISRYVYVIVAETYVDNPSMYTKIIWIDGDKGNVSSDNLLWVSDNEFDSHKTNKYKGVIKVDGKFTAKYTLMLGEYTTPQEAALARRILRDSLRNLKKNHPAKLLCGDKLRGSDYVSGMD